ncbi:MAG TPA: hypothetical protein VML55_25365 [Planctomycetaceae bacterium]|nr:hypothetical protein [Planctomycetaceae bacterium]
MSFQLRGEGVIWTRHAHANCSPASCSQASMYYDRVRATISSGTADGGLFLSQPGGFQASRGD